MLNKKLQKLEKKKLVIQKKIKLLKFDEFIVFHEARKIIAACRHYSYDQDAFEESCDLCLGGNDFHSADTCPFCGKWEAEKK